ncbi:MAG: hypothetical protein Q8N18_10350 [Opitutaceae bacterium]|nr:hypothetical protein [Opitutaceae bacterium]
MFPIAREYHLNVHRLDERAFGFSSNTIGVKVYFPLCHGVDVTVCLSNKFDPRWNAEDEQGICWFVKFLGFNAKVPDRIYSKGKVDAAMADYAHALRLVLNKFAGASPDLWAEFSIFSQGERETLMGKKTFPGQLELKSPFARKPFTSSQPSRHSKPSP